MTTAMGKRRQILEDDEEVNMAVIRASGVGDVEWHLRSWLLLLFLFSSSMVAYVGLMLCCHLLYLAQLCWTVNKRRHQRRQIDTQNIDNDQISAATESSSEGLPELPPTYDELEKSLDADPPDYATAVANENNLDNDQSPSKEVGYYVATLVDRLGRLASRI